MDNVLKILLSISLLLVNLVAVAQQDTLSFLHVSDTHLMFNLESYDPRVVHHREETRGYRYSNDHFKKFMHTIPKESNCDFVVITGDMIDFHDARTPKHNILEYQIEAFADLLDSFHVPIYLTLGNHDIFSYEWGDNKVIPNQLKAGKARATWIHNFDVFREGNYYRRIFQVGKRIYRFIFLDDSFYQFGKEEEVTLPYIDKPQAHWLKAEIEESDDDIEIIFMHIPFTEKSLASSSSNELLSLLSKYPTVKLVLSGHMHRDIRTDIPQENSTLIQFETNSLANDVSNWRYVQVLEDKITVFSVGSISDEAVVIPLD